mmetsp:Transcript_99622/g.181733  ORF Transcript_99622/g.181733 Transcript_99622/m.181733 type:complete len:265 (+) Transcript_99622:70-864(+)
MSAAQSPLLSNQKMRAACPSCGTQNEFSLPPGVHLAQTSCVACNTAFQVQGDQGPTPAMTPPAPGTAPYLPQNNEAPPAMMSMSPAPATAVPAAVATSPVFPQPQLAPPLGPQGAQPFYHHNRPFAHTLTRLDAGISAPQYAQPVMQPPNAMAMPLQPGQNVQPANAMAMPLQPGQNVVREMNVLSLPSSPVQLTCPGCGSVVMTQVRHEMGAGSWVTCLSVCILGSGACSCLGLLPCCMKECQDTIHACPRCHQMLGTKKFLF